MLRNSVCDSKMAMITLRIRACIFDVDGTLINSEDIYSDIYNNILQEYEKPDYPWRIKAVQQSRGTSVFHLFASIHRSFLSSQ